MVAYQRGIEESRQVLTTCSIFVPTAAELPFQEKKKGHWRREGTEGEN